MRILFLRFGKFSCINDNVYKILKERYPDDVVEVLDVLDVVRNKILFYRYIINIYFFIIEYGADIILGRKKMRDSFIWFFATSYIAKQASKSLKKIYKKEKYKFTFQTQSIFNGKINGIPHFVYTDHTTQTNLLYPDINLRQYIRSKRFIEKSERSIYRDATMIFTFGSIVFDSLINHYKISREKVLAIFAGPNVQDEYVENFQKYSSRNILFVGTEWQRKGGPILLKVFAIVLKKFPDATLTIIGCKPANISIPNCNVIGYIPLESVAKYYNLANIFCLPTLRDPFPNVLIEAMNYRLPIVVNNIGGIPDMIINDYNGYLIDNNVNDYAEAICKLFDNPEKCKQMGENGYQYAQSKFTWELVGKTIKDNIDKWI